MLSRMPIRKKFLCVTVLLTGTLLLLLFSSLRGVYAYRYLAQLLNQRAGELQTLSKLQEQVDEFRFTARISEPSPNGASFSQPLGLLPYSKLPDDDQQILQLGKILINLSSYESHLAAHDESDASMLDRSEELNMVHAMKKKVGALQTQLLTNPDSQISQLDLVELGQMTHKLPTYLLEWMQHFRDEERDRYRSWIAFNALSAASALIILGVAFWYFRSAVVQPLQDSARR